MPTSFFQFLKDSSGNLDATGNYSVTPNEFLATVPAGEVWNFSRMIISAKDSAGMDADKYGNNITLANGIEIKTFDADGNVLRDLTDGDPINSNGDWAERCYDTNVLTWGSGNEYMVTRWTFAASGSPIKLTPGQSLRVLLSDDYTGLLEHRFQVQGTISPWRSNALRYADAHISAITQSGTIVNEEATYSVTVTPKSGSRATAVTISFDGVAYPATKGPWNVWSALITPTVVNASTPVSVDVVFSDGTSKTGETETFAVEAAFVQSATWTGVTPTTSVGEDTFTPILSPNGDSVISSVTFDWGDGSAVSVGTVSPYSKSHSYPVDGVYTITVTITFSDATTQEETEDITVFAGP